MRTAPTIHGAPVAFECVLKPARYLSHFRGDCFIAHLEVDIVEINFNAGIGEHVSYR
jgi:hypothetical protein